MDEAVRLASALDFTSGLESSVPHCSSLVRKKGIGTHEGAKIGCNLCAAYGQLPSRLLLLGMEPHSPQLSPRLAALPPVYFLTSTLAFILFFRFFFSLLCEGCHFLGNSFTFICCLFFFVSATKFAALKSIFPENSRKWLSSILWLRMKLLRRLLMMLWLSLSSVS